MCCKCIVLLATSVAVALAEGQSQEEIEKLSAFLVVVGDQLALIASCMSDDDDGTSS